MYACVRVFGVSGLVAGAPLARAVRFHFQHTACTGAVDARTRARTALSHMLSSACLPAGPLGTSTVHLPPPSHVGSSHFGSTPSLNRWKSVPTPSQLGGLMLLYRL